MQTELTERQKQAIGARAVERITEALAEAKPYFSDNFNAGLLSFGVVLYGLAWADGSADASRAYQLALEERL